MDNQATALLMTHFHENLLGARKDLAQPLGKAEALHEAKRWLRGLTAAEVDSQLAKLPAGVRGSVVRLQPATARPYEHPYYWSAFILIGDPD